MSERASEGASDRPVFVGAKEAALTRFGIYKIIRRYTKHIVKQRSDGRPKVVSPHVWRHSTAVHGVPVELEREFTLRSNRLGVNCLQGKIKPRIAKELLLALLTRPPRALYDGPVSQFPSENDATVPQAYRRKSDKKHRLSLVSTGPWPRNPLSR